MKVQRYLYGRTNISQLKDRVGALQSPAEKAAEAYAPYKAVAATAGAVTDDLNMLAEQDRQLKAKEDAVQMEIMSKGWKFGIENIMNDPKYDNETQPDGSLSSAAMRDEIAKFRSEWSQGYNQIQDPKARANYEKLSGMTLAQNGIEIERFINEKREAWNTQSLFDLRNISIEVGDFADAEIYTEELRSKGAITQNEYEVDLTNIRKGEIDQASDVILDGYENSSDKDAFYARLATNDTLDPDVKASAISKVENHIGNLNRINKKKAQVAHVAILGDMTRMQAAIKSGQPLPMSISEFVKTGMGYTPEMDIQMMQYGKQLVLAQISGVKGDVAYAEFSARRSNGELIDNSTANQKHLDTEMEGGYTPEMSQQDKDDSDIDVMLDAGFVSHKWEEKFSTSLRDAKAIGEVAPQWEQLMLNMSINNDVQTKLDERTSNILTDAAKAIRAGVAPEMAGQNAIDISKEWARNEPEMQAKQEHYTQRPSYGDTSLSFGKRSARDGFRSLIDKSYDDSPYLFFGVADPGQAEFSTEDLQRSAFANYESYFYDAYMRTGDFDKATAAADLLFSQSYNMNNINGSWQIEKRGAKGDQEWRRETFITDNADEEVIYEGVKNKLSEIEDVSFQRPYEVNGELRYEVWGAEGPLQVDIVVDGKVDRQIIYESITQEAADTKELQEIRKESEELIEGYQKEYDAAVKAESFSSIYGRKETKATIRDTAGKIAKEKEKLKIRESNITGEMEF